MALSIRALTQHNDVEQNGIQHNNKKMRLMLMPSVTIKSIMLNVLALDLNP
jgi:hypothetical protein